MNTVFDEARSLRAIVIRKPAALSPVGGLAALKPPAGGPGQRTPVPDRERVTARLLLNQPSRHVVFVFQARPAPETRGLVPRDRRQSFPLDRPPPPHRSLAMRPFPATRWDQDTGGLGGWGQIGVEKVQGVEIVGLCSLSAERKPGTCSHGKASRIDPRPSGECMSPTPSTASWGFSTKLSGSVGDTHSRPASCRPAGVLP